MSAVAIRKPSFLIGALGIAQIFAWGSSYYLPAVLAAPMTSDTDWPLAYVVGGLSIGLLISGLCAPRAGRAIQEHGGRPVLAIGSLLLAGGLACIGLAPSLPFFFAAWILMGAGMACSLYDAGFSTLGRLYGSDARSAITTLTLYGGFASTVCWPLSAWLVENIGWREACFVYAAIQLAISLPLILFALPKQALKHVSDTASPAHAPLPKLAAKEKQAFIVLALALTLAGVVQTLVSVHLITLLQGRGVALAAAVSFGALIGPSQVGARVVEMMFGKHYHPGWTLAAAALLIAIGVCLLAAGFPVVALCLILYGAGNGIWSIARGTLPLRLFEPGHYAPIMGRLALPNQIAQAMAPTAGALVLAQAGVNTAFGMLAALAVANVILAAWLLRFREERPARS